MLKPPRVDRRSRLGRLASGVFAALAMFALVLSLACAIVVAVIVLAPVVAVRLAVDRFSLVAQSR